MGRPEDSGETAATLSGGNWLTPEQGRRLLDGVTPSTAREFRDLAMTAMLIGCGLRRAELLALQIESIGDSLVQIKHEA